MDDERFSKAFTDPRFRRPNKKKNKVVIDDRFKEMFTDEKFKSEYKIDKRGRPIHESTSTNMRKFYREEKDEKKIKKTKKKKTSLEQPKLTKDDESSEEKKEESKPDVSAEKIKEEISDDDDDDDDESSMSESSSDDEEEEEVDLLRGVGNVESSDSSDDDDDEFYKDDNPSEAFDHKWNELDETAPVMDDNVSSRLAICNMDWDRITATDLYMLLHSFKPQEGAIYKVSVYPSEFGKERMAEEKLRGPKEIRELKEEDVEDVECREEEKFHQEVLRQYQLNRLKYYYAVVECDSPETANHIYTACDGQGFETSAVKMDLRFVPDGMTFDDDQPTQVCDHLPDKDLYQPNRFNTTALNQSKVELTWDETDKKRVSLMTKKFTDDDIEGQDLLDYIAPSSDEDEDDDDEIDEDAERERPVCGVSRLSTVDQIQQYRSLLLGDMDEENNKDDDDGAQGEVHMQTTFNVAQASDEGSGLEDSGDESSNDDDDGENGNGESFFAGSGDGEDSEDEEEKEEKQKEAEIARKEADDKEKARLALVMMADDEDEEQQQRHFNMDDIIKKQQQEGKNKKRRKRKKRTAGKNDEDDDDDKNQDDFRIDMNDQRFKGVFNDPQFAIDPNHPSFKPTKAMLELVEEKRKQKSRNEGAFRQPEPKTSPSQPQPDSDHDDEEDEKKEENEGKDLAAALSFIKQANARPKTAAGKAKKATFSSKYVTEFNNYSSDSEDDEPKAAPKKVDAKVDKNNKKRLNPDAGVVASKKKKKKQK